MYLDFEVKGRQGGYTGEAKAVRLAAFDSPHVRGASFVRLVAADARGFVLRDVRAVVASTTLK